MKVLDSNKLRSTAVRLAATSGVALAMAFSATPAYAKQVRLFVDPGHGGKDPGAVSRGIKEKDTNLAISRLVVKAAKRQGWKVKMSRNSDKFISLRARPRMAARWKATSTVSVHSNSTGRKALGNMTIYRTKKSKKLGKAITKELNRTTSYRDIGNRRDVRGLAVLRTKKPTVIVEVLSVTAPKEKRRLRNQGERRKMAEAIVRGVAKAEGVKYIPPKKEAKSKPAPAVSKPATAPAPDVTTPTPRPNPQTSRPATRAVPTTGRPAPRKADPQTDANKQTDPTLTVSSGLTTAADTTARKNVRKQSSASSLRVETRPAAPQSEEKTDKPETLIERLLDLLVN